MKTVTNNRRGGLKYLSALLIVPALAWGLPAAGGFWVRAKLEKTLKAGIGGTLVPGFFTPSFVLRNAQLEWADKVSVGGGNLKVEYDPFFFIRRDLLKVRVSGKGLRAKLLGAWAEVQGVENLDSAALDASLGFGVGGLREIYFVEVSSPAFQFRIKKSEKE